MKKRPVGRPPKAADIRRRTGRSFAMSTVTDEAITAVAERLEVSRSEVVSIALCSTFPDDFAHLSREESQAKK